MRKRAAPDRDDDDVIIVRFSNTTYRVPVSVARNIQMLATRLREDPALDSISFNQYDKDASFGRMLAAHMPQVHRNLLIEQLKTSTFLQVRAECIQVLQAILDARHLLEMRSRLPLCDTIRTMGVDKTIGALINAQAPPKALGGMSANYLAWNRDFLHEHRGRCYEFDVSADEELDMDADATDQDALTIVISFAHDAVVYVLKEK